MNIKEIGEMYKAFSKSRESNRTPVPKEIVRAATAIKQTGKTYAEIADACGVSLVTVRSWIVKSADKADGRSGASAKAPKLTSFGSTAQGKSAWISVRIQGRELEVRRSDLLSLLAVE